MLVRLIYGDNNRRTILRFRMIILTFKISLRRNLLDRLPPLKMMGSALLDLRRMISLRVLILITRKLLINALDKRRSLMQILITFTLALGMILLVFIPSFRKVEQRILLILVIRAVRFTRRDRWAIIINRNLFILIVLEALDRQLLQRVLYLILTSRFGVIMKRVSPLTILVPTLWMRITRRRIMHMVAMVQLHRLVIRLLMRRMGKRFIIFLILLNLLVIIMVSWVLSGRNRRRAR